MLTELFDKYKGTREYTGIVETIQKWFYGYVSRTSWCATSISYFMDALGKLGLIGGRSENVYYMMQKCKAYAAEHPEVKFFDKDHIPEKLKKDDILFWLWSGEMGVTGNKHVGVCAEDTTSKTVPCIGGNQKDMICTAYYDKSQLYAVYRWNNENPSYNIGWNRDSSGWWYAKTADTYCKSEWKVINHHWYYFDDNGYAVTGVREINGKRYLFETSGDLECACMKTAEDGSLVEWYIND